MRKELGLSLVAGGLLMLASTLVEGVTFNTRQKIYQIHLIDGKGFRYDQQGLKVLTTIPCRLVSADPRRSWGVHFEGQQKATIAKIPYDNWQSEIQIIDTRNCKYPII